MSGSIRTETSHLRLVEDAPKSAEERFLVLARSARLERFAAASAAAGLRLEEAVGLALEHALALKDAAAFGLDGDTARRVLNEAAAGARASRPLGEGGAAYLRRLGRRSAIPTPTVPETLRIELDERTCTRVRGTLSEGAIRVAVVEEMIAWELAATLEGRTMCEWALLSLAHSRRAA